METGILYIEIVSSATLQHTIGTLTIFWVENIIYKIDGTLQSISYKNKAGTNHSYVYDKVTLNILFQPERKNENLTTL